MSKLEGMMKPKTARDDFDNAFWSKDPRLVVREEATDSRVYDLEQRTAQFGETVVDFAKTIPQNPVTNRIIAQPVGAGTSVGANYVEADDAVKERVFEKDRHLPEGSAGDEAFSTDGGACGARVETGRPKDLDGGEGAAFDFLQNLEKRKTMMKFAIPARSFARLFVSHLSSFLRHSAFELRH